MIDHAKKQLQIIERDDLREFATGINQEAWILGWKQRKWPTKARYFYALQAVYAPRQERIAAE
jgi:hypothetical protein